MQLLCGAMALASQPLESQVFEDQPLASQPLEAQVCEDQPLDSQPLEAHAFEDQPLDSQPHGLTVLDDPYPDSEDSQDDVVVVEGQVAHLPVENHAIKKQKLSEPEPVPKCLDQIKWVGSVPFVLSHTSQKIYCGNSVMYRTKVGDLTVVHCLTNCCSLGGHPDSDGNCGCFCHLLAKSYQYQWPPTSIEG